MTQPTDPGAGQAYTRTSVERYLSAAAAEQSRLESAIADARRRTEAALQEEERLHAVQHGVGGTSNHRERAPFTDQHPTLPLTMADDGSVWRDENLPTAAAVTDVRR